VSVFATDNRTEFGDDPGIFTISRTGNTDQPLTVPFVLSNTAIMGIDYDTVPETVTIPAGQSSVTIQIVPINTGEIVDKLVVLTITSSPTYNKGPAAVVIIGPPPVVTVVVTNGLTGYGEAPAIITVSRTGDTTYPLSLPFTWGGDGVEGADFMACANPLVIPAGQSSVQCLITAIHNHDPDVHNPEMDFTASPDYSFDGGVDYAEVTINRSNFLEFVWAAPAAFPPSDCEPVTQDLQIGSFGMGLSMTTSPIFVSPESDACGVEVGAPWGNAWFFGGYSATGEFIYSKAATNCVFHWNWSEFGGVPSCTVACTIKVNGVTVMSADQSIPSGTDIPFTLPAGSGKHCVISIAASPPVNCLIDPTIVYPCGAICTGSWNIL
jgi:hypothetical protein